MNLTLNFRSPRDALSKLKSKMKKDKEVARAASLPNLPVELLLIIEKDLELHERFYLAQTCQRLHAILSRPCKDEIDRLSRLNSGGKKFLNGLVSMQPGRLVCNGCGRIRIVSCGDLPSRSMLTKPLNRGLHPQHSLADHSVCRLNSGLHQWGLDYNLHHYHVQMALKYSTFEQLDKVSNRYLSKLLAFHRSQFKNEFRGLTAMFMAQPKVVNGRFLLYCRWSIHAHSGAQDLCLGTVPLLKLCPHLSALTKPLSYKIDCAIKRGRHYRSRYCYSCDHCLTDYGVQGSARDLTLESWQDFGGVTTIRPLHDSTERRVQPGHIPIIDASAFNLPGVIWYRYAFEKNPANSDDWRGIDEKFATRGLTAMMRDLGRRGE